MPFSFTLSSIVKIQDKDWLKGRTDAENPVVFEPFLYTLIHELAHLADRDLAISRSYNSASNVKTNRGIPSAEEKFFNSMSPQIKELSEKAFGFRTEMKSSTPERLKAISGQFEASDFVSPYSTANPNEYFAEMLSRLLMKKYLDVTVTDRLMAFGTDAQNAPVVFWKQTDRICIPNILQKAISLLELTLNKPFAPSEFDSVCK